MTLPKRFVDAHHHFLDTAGNPFQTFLARFVPNERYGPSEYHRDVVRPLEKAGVAFVGSVHVECMPDDGLAEALWVQQNTAQSETRAIVASCDLAKTTADADLAQLTKSCPRLRGIRWILDCVGRYRSGTPTHVATLRHDGIDYLRGSEGGYEGAVVPRFERGYALLKRHGLSFDLQCAPEQLPAAVQLIARHPDIRVCLDHLGKPRTVLGMDDSGQNDSAVLNENEMRVWREGMKAAASLPNVYVKISMLGYAVPGWIRTEERIGVVRQLVRETVEMFGPERCMVATNWWKSAALSDADGLSDVGPDPVRLLGLIADFLKDYSEEDRDHVFCKTAQQFYRL